MAAIGRILIGSEESDHLLIEPTRREWPETADYWDGNWLYALVRIRTGAFRAENEAQLRTDELTAFGPRLAMLYECPSGTATFETMDNWVRIAITGEGRGRLLPACQ